MSEEPQSNYEAKAAPHGSENHIQDATAHRRESQIRRDSSQYAPPKATRKYSVSTSDHSGHGPSLGQPHRRMSRIDPQSHAAFMGRRMSMYRRGSVAASLRTDRTDQSHAPLVKLANTYRLQPNSEDKFQPAKVRKIVHSILESYLEGEVYEARKCAHLVQSLTDVIKTRIKEMNFPRYKIICSVVIGQKCDQGIRCASRCLWNDSLDGSASASYENSSLFAIATVYALYFE